MILVGDGHRNKSLLGTMMKLLAYLNKKCFDETTVHLVRDKVIRTRLRYFTPIAMN